MSVYFAQAGDYIKIGYSREPLARFSTITRAGTRPPDVPFAGEAHPIGWVPGDTRTEILLHGRFVAHRVEGEWFRMGDTEVRALIWEDPHGVDLDRMSAAAVIAANRWGLSREQIAACGIPVEGRPLADVLEAVFS